ncbi:MAG TPA: response regulator transcription factor, partial [Pseudogracilibacillus sp.]|nr:response regulator transcription factor [Pseudogracilibacillus sp.]
KDKQSITIGELTLYPANFQAYLNDTLLDLTRKEFEVLVYLSENKGQIVSREELLHKVWGYDYAGDTRTVDMQVSRLRDKIEQNSKEPKYIKTVWGFGYRMDDPR